jgi:tetratricopeptide (TPR) repeat protein
MRYTNDALLLSQKLNWQQGIALYYRQKGTVYYVLNDNLNAMDCFQRALKEGETLHSKKFDATIYNNIANIYSDLKQYDKALDYYNKLLATAREENQRKEETIALINLGTVYTELTDYTKALDYFQKGLLIATKDSNMRLLPFIQCNIGILFNKKNEYSNALPYFEKSISYADERSSETSKAPALEGLAKIYLNGRDYAKAENYCNQSLLLSQQLNSADWQSTAWQTLSSIYEAQHKSDKALEAYKKYIAFRDSVWNDEKKSEITRKEMQFEYEKKEALLKAEHDKKEALANAEIDQQRIVKNSAMGGAGVLLIASITSFIFYKRRRDAEDQKKEADFKVQVSDTEMKVLRLQMNPHFIFNSLNSISDYVQKHDIKAADNFLSKFAKVMRLTLEHSEQKAITLEEDLKALELYMQLESSRLNNKFTYEIKVDKNIDKENTLVPPMILQPFVENSIWHGISKINGEGKILIEIKKEEEMINCIVEDNGPGIQENHHSLEKKSLGMKITRARIDIINKIKKSKAAIHLLNKEDGVRVEVRLPLELSF